MTTDQDLIIIGAGGAGLSAAQYGARGNLRRRRGNWQARESPTAPPSL